MMSRERITSAIEVASAAAIVAGATLTNIAAGLAVAGLMGLAWSWWSHR
jgi:hypothetical protein